MAFSRGRRSTSWQTLPLLFDSSAVCNVSQLVHAEDNEIVPTRDWPTFLLPHFRKIFNIEKYYHFRFSSQCSPESTPTRPRYHCRFSEIPGNLLAINFLFTFGRRVGQMSGSGISTSKYAHSAPRSNETPSPPSHPPQTPSEDTHQYLKNSFFTLPVTYLQSSVLMTA